MKALTRLIVAAVGNIPVEPNATAIRNYLKKNYNAVPTPKAGGSNPYSDAQIFNVFVKDIKGLQNQLKAEGWVIDNTWVRPGMANKFVSPQKAEIKITLTSPTKSGYYVIIIGSKKAKRSNIPYYD